MYGRIGRWRKSTGLSKLRPCVCVCVLLWATTMLQIWFKIYGLFLITQLATGLQISGQITSACVCALSRPHEWKTTDRTNEIFCVCMNGFLRIWPIDDRLSYRISLARTHRHHTCAEKKMHILVRELCLLAHQIVLINIMNNIGP